MPRTPEGQHVVSAYLSCKGAADAIAFYTEVFGAVEVGQRYVDQSDGRIGHAEFDIGDTRMMIADEYPEIGSVSPLTLGGASVSFAVYVDNVDAVYELAVARGATGQRPPADQPYGARAAWLVDPWGHRWTVQTLLDRPATAFEGFDLVDAVGPADADYVMPARARELLHGPAQLGYFTLSTDDLTRATLFFSALFGWKIEPNGHIANIDPPGGLVVRTQTDAHLAEASPVTLYFQVADLDRACARVGELGGRVMLRTTYASGDNAECTDDQGSRFDLFRPIPGYERQ